MRLRLPLCGLTRRIITWRILDPEKNYLTETFLLIGLGLLLVIYTIARWTDLLTYTPPVIGYFILCVVLSLWVVSLNRRS